MRNIRFLILLSSVTVALAVALLRPLPARSAVLPGPHAARAPKRATRASTVKVVLPPPFPAKKRRLLAAQRRLTLGVHVARFARRLLGVPYRYGGSSPRTGFDCSGFVRYVYGHFGISLSHSSFADYLRGTHVGRWALKPGDLVFFDREGHVGIYVGHSRFIHAPHSGTVVSISTLSGWYGARYDGARRLS
jgi:cell wall-associated NlpC family hydrolase